MEASRIGVVLLWVKFSVTEGLADMEDKVTISLVAGCVGDVAGDNAGVACEVTFEFGVCIFSVVDAAIPVEGDLDEVDMNWVSVELCKVGEVALDD